MITPYNPQIEIVSDIDDDKEIDVCCETETRAKELQKKLTVDSQIIPVEVLVKAKQQLETRFAVVVQKEYRDDPSNQV